MSRTSLRASAALVSAVTVASLLGLAGPAMAQGGSHPTPGPAAVSLDCSGGLGDPTTPAIADPDVAVNYAGDAGCVGVRVSNAGLRLAWVMLADGWGYDVKDNGAGTNSRVQLQFTNATTGQKLNFRFEQGRTVVG